ncbi:class F sortase [Streptomyces longwoodensis]|uniref:class F sortase n=1 Tax=Streptomyces longwoodensis TaxID=68231 RepID=UPI00379230BB
MREAPGPSTARSRLLAGVTWAVLLSGLWLWGLDVTAVRPGRAVPAVTGAAAPGRPPGTPLPPAAEPLGAAPPQRIDIPELGVQAPVVPRGLDARGAIDTPPYDQAGVVGWYAHGATPGARGAALLVGHVDTRTRPAVFARLGTLGVGAVVRVVRADGRVAVFTVEDVDVVPRDRFDAARAYGPRRAGRAELRLVTCGGTFDQASGTYSANVVVSAYLTGTAR